MTKEKRREPQKQPEPRTVWTNDEALRLNYLLQKALPTLEGRPHWWAGYQLGKLKPIIKAYKATLEKHPDFQGYSDGEKAGMPKDELDKKFPAFAEEDKRLREEEVDLSIRKFKVEWALEYKANSLLTAAVVDYDLFDDPIKGEDLLYTEDPA